MLRSSMERRTWPDLIAPRFPGGCGVCPRQLLLALINATAILVIVAAVLALVALSRLNNFAANVATTMTEAVLSRVDLPAKDTLANLRNLTAEVRALGNTLREIRSGDHSITQVEIARLNETLAGLNVSVDRLADAKLTLTDEAAVRLGQSVTDMLLKLRRCSSTAGQMELRRQGASAPGGAIDYVTRGKMIGGFGLVAYPAEYGNSGIMTFLVNHQGVVYEKDLGANTARIAQSINEYNPDSTWRRVDPSNRE